MYFRIRKEVELRLMMEAVSVKLGVEMSALRFHFDEKRIKANQTPNELELEDEFVIDVFVFQLGGCSFCHRR
ncbi:unnamed protein product [Microthlaspi erraticum]|uniref:Ubiquitin-like domain-containing protein n=1 Tax=Microthlaspi erraticum TaxID=1685480 RepID=A0A6D2LCH6_9BRAS|nr:unnamed protein product [Microthlaspi erraticum]